MTGKELREKCIEIINSYSELKVNCNSSDEDIYMIERGMLDYNNKMIPVWKTGWATWAGEYGYILITPSYNSKIDTLGVIDDVFEEFELNEDEEYDIKWDGHFSIEILNK